MNENEIAVDLRLQMDKLGQDAAKAGKIVSNGLATSVKGLGKTDIEIEDERAKRQAEYERRLASAQRRRRNEALDEKDRLKEMTAMDRQRKLFEKNNPIGSANPKGSKGGFPSATLLAGLGLGIPGVGSIAALSQMNPAAAAAVAGMRLLQFEVGALTNTFKRATEQARQLYAKTLTSGFGTQMTAQRSLLSKTIGVGENEVFQFGAAVAVLNGRLQLAGDTISRMNPALTASAWNWKVLGADMDALSAQIAGEVAPAFNLLSRLLDSLVKTAINNSDAIMHFLSNSVKSLLAQFPIGKQIAEIMVAEIKHYGKESAPPPVAFMKQMKASQWEHMGLVMGTGGGTNYQKEAVNQLKKVVEGIDKLRGESKIASAVGGAFGFHIPSLP